MSEKFISKAALKDFVFLDRIISPHPFHVERTVISSCTNTVDSRLTSSADTSHKIDLFSSGLTLSVFYGQGSPSGDIMHLSDKLYRGCTNCSRSCSTEVIRVKTAHSDNLSIIEGCEFTITLLLTRAEETLQLEKTASPGPDKK